MGTFLTPKTITSKIDSMFANFWWGKGKFTWQHGTP